MSDDDVMIEEFKIEAQEMFETSEDGFLKIEKGEDFISNYNLIFRAFHSLKGAAGMFGLDLLQGHMHKLETLFEAQKSRGTLEKAQIDYFLSGIDKAKALLDGSTDDRFTYYTIEEFKTMAQVEKKAPATPVSTPITTAPPVAVEKMVSAVKKEEKKRGLFYVIDDEEAILDILSDHLVDMGFEVKTFSRAQALLDEMDLVLPDVLLSDINMPGMDGIQLIHRLREEKINIPVIFISGYITKEAILDALSQGAYGFIEKPFNEMQLTSICEHAFSKVQTEKLLQKSINYILYQFSDLDQYLKEQGRESLRQSLKADLSMILEQQKKLRTLK